MSVAELALGPFASARGSVALPGSKSISNRLLLLAALAEGATETRGLLDSDDTRRMIDALVALGVAVERIAGTDDVRVTGTGRGFAEKRARLFLGNAGTAFRPLTAVLALGDGEYELSGVPRMHERPIGDLVDALRPLGARIDYLGEPGYPPLAIHPAVASATERVAVRGDVSSQFLTALLLALPTTGREWTIEVLGELVSKPYVEITLNLLARFGVAVERDGWRGFHVAAGQRLRSPGSVLVEGDASSASYFLAAGAIGRGPVRVTGVGRDSIQGDVRFAELLEQMGARVARGPDWIEASGDGALRGVDADVNHIPDAAMTAAVVALFARGPTVLRNIGGWRVKETDRIHAMATELAKLGARVETGEDWLRVTPPARIVPAVIDTYDDHRMAMCFSLASFGTRVTIRDPECVAKTFPGYFAAFASLVGGNVRTEAADPASRPGASTVPVVTVDGPAASGKGTVAAAVAAALGFQLLDSGALYRLVALKALETNTPTDDEGRLGELAERLDVRFGAGGRVTLDGRDVGAEIRGEACSAHASRVAVHPRVRAALLERQRAFRRPPGLVADGRDMGTVVFPDAEVKVYLSASAEERARRRYKQLMDKGMPANIDDLLRDIRERDARDTGRAAAPLAPAPDAVVLDTTSLTPDEAVAFVLRRCRERGVGTGSGA